HERNHDDRDQTQLDVDIQNRSPIDEKEQYDPSYTNGLFRKEAPQGIYIRRDAFDQVTSRRLTVIGKAQALDVIKQKISQAARDAFCSVGCKASGKKGKPAFNESKQDKSKSYPQKGLCERSKSFSFTKDIICKKSQQKIERCFCKH